MVRAAAAVVDVNMRDARSFEVTRMTSEAELPAPSKTSTTSKPLRSKLYQLPRMEMRQQAGMSAVFFAAHSTFVKTHQAVGTGPSLEMMLRVART
jgi:hypothetical protein